MYLDPFSSSHAHKETMVSEINKLHHRLVETQKKIETIETAIQKQADSRHEELQSRLEKVTELVKKQAGIIAELGTQFTEQQKQISVQERQIAQLNNGIAAQARSYKVQFKEMQRQLAEKQESFERMLFNAAKQGNEKTIDFVLTTGVDVKCVDELDRNALHLAAMNGHAHLVSFLLDKNRGLINSQNGSDGGTPLHFAAAMGNEETVQVLLDNHADFTLRDAQERTAYEFTSNEKIREMIVHKMLFVGSKQGKLEMVQEAVKLGADVNAKAKDGETALHKATYGGYKEVITFLLERGATEQPDKHGSTPSDYARDKGDVRQLIANTQLLKAAEAENQAAIDTALERSAQLSEAKDAQGSTALHLIVAKGNEVLVRYLIGLRASVNAQDIILQTPLHKAAVIGHKGIIDVLLEAGADIHMRDNQGNKPSKLAKDEDLRDHIHESFGAIAQRKKQTST